MAKVLRTLYFVFIKHLLTISAVQPIVMSHTWILVMSYMNESKDVKNADTSGFENEIIVYYRENVKCLILLGCL